VEVGAVDCPDYEMKALEFLTKPATPSMNECVRQQGDVVRYDSASEEFAVFSVDGFIRTYMKASVAVHGLSSNIAYFRQECNRVFI
jgi:pyocin large subunit-like protein